MSKPQRRILIYSHDSFGLGHLRRCRAIAHGLVDAYRNLSVLILSGSPIIGSFEFKSRVDFIRVPGVIKLRHGDYVSLQLHLDINQTLAIRSSIIEHTALSFKPDIFLVDKEPLGLRGEIEKTLKVLKKHGCRLVLGLRDVMDDPGLLAPEWERKKVMPALRNLYDQIWVYGLPQICNPMEGICVPPAVRDKVHYTGYLRRHVPRDDGISTGTLPGYPRPYILVTTGGGGDGEELIDWVIRAYEDFPDLAPGALLVFGPFMPHKKRGEFLQRIAKLPRVEAITFDSVIEGLIKDAEGVICMGGYNTFCEILSLDKRAIVIPRTRPRMEQYIRTSRADELGLVRMLEGDGRRDSATMAAAVRDLPRQRLPSSVSIPGLLDGIDTVNRLTGDVLNQKSVALA